MNAKWKTHCCKNELHIKHKLSLFSVSITDFFSLHFSSHCSSSQPWRPNSGRTVADPGAQSGWVIHPQKSSCQRACCKTWDPCRVGCHTCTGPRASPAPLGQFDTGRCSRRPSYPLRSSFSPFVVACVETPTLVPWEPAVMGPKERVPRWWRELEPALVPQLEPEPRWALTRVEHSLHVSSWDSSARW